MQNESSFHNIHFHKLLQKFYFVYLKGRLTQTMREREQFAFHWFTPKMAAVSGLGAGLKPEVRNFNPGLSCG